MYKSDIRMMEVLTKIVNNGVFELQDLDTEMGLGGIGYARAHYRNFILRVLGQDKIGGGRRLEELCYDKNFPIPQKPRRPQQDYSKMIEGLKEIATNNIPRKNIRAAI